MSYLMILLTCYRLPKMAQKWDFKAIFLFSAHVPGENTSHFSAIFARFRAEGPTLVAHDCGYPLSRYTCRATRVAADFLDFIAFCRCSTGVALHPLKILVSHLPPPCAGRCRTEIWVSEKVSRYTGVSQLQLWVSRYTVQLRARPRSVAGQRDRQSYPVLMLGENSSLNKRAKPQPSCPSA